MQVKGTEGHHFFLAAPCSGKAGKDGDGGVQAGEKPRAAQRHYPKVLGIGF